MGDYFKAFIDSLYERKNHRYNKNRKRIDTKEWWVLKR